MPTRDFIVKLAGESKGYQSAMDQATQALDKYQKQNLSTSAAIKTVTTTLSRYISVAALAKGATEAITATLHGSEQMADKFDATMFAAKTTVSEFFASLSTGDFSQFQLGLDNIISKAKDAYDALDRLSNASISWGYFQTSRMADLTELQSIVNDKSLPMSQRQDAAAQMAQIQQEMQGYVEGYRTRALEAMAKELAKSTNIDWTLINRSDLEKNLRLDLIPDVGMSEAEKQKLDQMYQEYLTEADKIAQKYKGRLQTTMHGGAAASYSQRYVQSPEQKQAEAEEMAALAVKYKDAVLYNQTLVRGTQDWLENLVAIVQQADAAERSMRRVNSAVQQAQNIQPGTAGGTSTAAAAPKAAGMSGLEYERMMLTERLKLADRFSEEYIDLQQQLREAEYQMQVERLTATIQNEEQLAAALELAERVKNNDLYQIAMEGYVGRLRLAEEFSSQAQEIEDSTESITNSMTSLKDTFDGIDDGARSVESLGRAITQVSDKKWAQGMGGMLSGVGSAVQAYAKLAAAAQTAATAQAAAETPTVLGKIAVIGTMLGEFAAVISQLRSINSYAEGGVIPGRNWNDGITARVSSGEMIINEADQKRLYDDIHSGRLGGGGGPAVVTGEEIFIAVSNYGKRMGWGELAFVGG
jgi:hypothetical protein